MKALRIIVNGLSNFENGELKVDFIASKKVSTYETNVTVNPLFNSIYKQNSMSFVGINASGKTTTLAIIESLLSIYIDNESISFHTHLSKTFSDQLNVKMYLYDEEEKAIYLINSTIMKENKDSANSKLYFYDEDLYLRKVSKRVNKKNIFDNELYDHIQNRRGLNNSYLKDEDTIFSAILNEKEDRNEKVFELINLTDMNVFAYYLKNMTNESFIRYLDPSVELFRIKDEENYNLKKHTLPKFEIKFKNSDVIHTSDIADLGNILSSGTIKGLNIFANVVTVLSRGGYLIIDEIENHLNKRIVSSILEFFLSDINNNGATLLFSTHYVEVLDEIDRSDSIYVLNKEEAIKVKKLSDRLGEYDRSDKKKSEIFLSGVVDTVPDYKSYQNIKKDIRDYIRGN